MIFVGRNINDSYTNVNNKRRSRCLLWIYCVIDDLLLLQNDYVPIVHLCDGNKRILVRKLFYVTRASSA